MRKRLLPSILPLLLAVACADGSTTTDATSLTSVTPGTPASPVTTSPATTGPVTTSPATTSPATTSPATTVPEAPPLNVPTIPAPTVDGTFEAGEWDGAVTTTMDDGSEVWWGHADGYLYVAIETAQHGAKNLAIVEGDRLRMLHSSLSLGSAEYALSDGEWILVQGFEWCCRLATDAAALEDLFASEGWRSHVTGVGPYNQVEYQVEWPADGARLALAHVGLSGSASFWPPWISDSARSALVDEPQDVARFDASSWVMLTLDEA